jgi:hypothetical protein
LQHHALHRVQAGRAKRHEMCLDHAGA